MLWFLFIAPYPIRIDSSCVIFFALADSPVLNTENVEFLHVGRDYSNSDAFLCFSLIDKCFGVSFSPLHLFIFSFCASSSTCDAIFFCLFACVNTQEHVLAFRLCATADADCSSLGHVMIWYWISYWKHVPVCLKMFFCKMYSFIHDYLCVVCASFVCVYPAVSCIGVGCFISPSTPAAHFGLHFFAFIDVVLKPQINLRSNTLKHAMRS